MSDEEPWSIAANHVQNGVAVGGKLARAQDGVLFSPHGFEKFIDKLLDTPLEGLLIPMGRREGAQTVAIRFSEIASVSKLEGKLKVSTLLEGGGRDRLQISLKDGSEQVFVVSSLDKVIEYLSAQL